ncbi:MAG: hypothetical protein FWD34_03165 [Oscillospiraceae bacterium]|nr:hypothetical protein [Oscillospiraceae bacterium]
MKVDFHSHILPYVDDGAQNIIEALVLLKTLKEDGVDIVVATPHLYLDRDSPATLQKKRDKSFDMLMDVCPENYPKIIKGSEIYFSGIKPSTDLSGLRLGDTDYILLEFPYFRRLDKDFIDELKYYINAVPYKVIFSHVERYFKYSDRETIYEILKIGCLAQVNCDSLLLDEPREYTLELIEQGYALFLGSDAHSLKYRPPRFREAEAVIRNRLGDDVFENMMKVSAEVLGF